MNARRHGVGIWLTNEEEVGILPAPWYPPNNLEVNLTVIGVDIGVERQKITD